MSTQSGSSRMHRKHMQQYIVGYILSLVLTAIAFVLALASHMPIAPLIVILVILAGFQIFVQLYFFMHITEGDGLPYHSAALILGLIFTFAIALLSIWIMGFHSQVS